MNLRTKLLLSAVFAAGIAGVSPAAAQGASAAAQIGAGAAVKDPAGGEVGTVTKVEGDFVILKTDKHEVRLPKTSFAAANCAFLIALTRDQLNAEVDKALASGPGVAAGVTVYGPQDGVVGRVEAVDAEFATVKLVSSKLVKLPLTAFGKGPSGPVIGMTAAELEAVAGSAPAAGADAPRGSR